MANEEAPAQRRLAAAAAAGACVVAWTRLTLSADSFTQLALEVLRHPGVLDSNPIVGVAFHSAYAWGPRTAAQLISLLPGSPAMLSSALLATVWALCAWMFFRLARLATGSKAAAAYSTLAFGANLPLGYSDSPYTLTGLDRMLGVPSLLWGLAAMLEKRFWAAWAGVVAATYMHAHPAMYCWAWLFFEDARAAFKDPAARPGFVLRIAAASAAAWPLLHAAGGNPFNELDPALVRMTLSLVSQWMTGSGIVMFDLLFALEGYALIALCLWALRDRADTRPWMEASALGLLMTAVGAATYMVQLPSSPLWGLLAKLQLGGATYLPELAGDLLLGLWLMRAFEVDAPLGASLAVAHTVSSHYHDPVLRAGVLAAGFALAAGRNRMARAVLASAVILPIAYALAPAPFKALAGAVGLQGGIFQLTSFNPGLSASLMLGAGAGALAARRRLPAPAWAAAVALCMAVMVSIRDSERSRDKELDSMAARVRLLPADSILLPSPLDLVSGISFMANAGRQVLVCRESFLFALHFGPSAAPLGAVLRDVGIDPDAVRGWDGLQTALSRADAELDAKRLSLLARTRGVTHLLSRGPRPWLGAPLATAGPYQLYSAR